MVHALAMLPPFGRQIRSLNIHSRRLRAILLILDDMKPMPRLASFTLRSAYYSELICLPYELLHFVHSGPVDLSREFNCHQITLHNWILSSEIAFSSQTCSLTISFTITHSVKWDEISPILKACTNLQYLSLDGIALEDIPPPSSAHSGQSTPSGIILWHLSELRMHGDAASIYTLISPLHLPSLVSVTLTLRSGGRDALQDWGRLIPSVFPPRRDGVLQIFSMSIYERTWTNLHDALMIALLPSHLDTVVLRFFVDISMPDALEVDQATQSLSPTVGDLSFHLHSTQSCLGSILARWDPESITVRTDVWNNEIFSPWTAPGNPDRFPKTERVHTISFEHVNREGLSRFLLLVQAPQLQVVKILRTRNFSMELSSNEPLAAGFEYVCNEVRGVSIELTSDYDHKPDLRPYIYLFPNVSSLEVMIDVLDSGVVVQNTGSMLQVMESPYVLLQLSKLTVDLNWFCNYPSIEAVISQEQIASIHEDRRKVECMLCDSMSVIVRDRLIQVCSPLKAQLFVEENFLPRKPEVAGLIWSSE